MLIKEFTYYRRSFQSDRIEHSPQDPPGKPKSQTSRKVNELLFPDHKGQLKEQIKLFDNTFNYICDQFHQKEKQVYFGRRIHTEENSKAKGYIRNNCETQSTHCIKIQARLITV